MKLLPLILLVTALTATTHGLEIVAHRGASYDAPENTMASFRLGWEQQADADELDIYLTKDGKIIVLHDATTKRTTGVELKPAEQTAEALRALDAGSWKGPQWAGEKLPLLEEVVATIPKGKRLFIEIKCGPEVLPELERVLQKSGKTPVQLVIIGFGYETVREAKQRFPKLQVYWLVSPKKGSKGLTPSVGEMVAKTKAAGLDGLDLNQEFALDAVFVSEVKGAGLKLYTWTVDDPEVAKSHMSLGVDGITTNRAAWLREQLGVVPAAAVR
jgi:glycerophosphoryl diester phosphodiesterase